MTIAAAYLTSEGVVLGADSATLVSRHTPDGTVGVVQVLRHAQKVFEVGENSRFGLCTYGSGSVGGVSHRGIVARLADKLKKDTTVADAKNLLVEVVKDASRSAAGEVGDIGYILGGWNEGGHEAECYHVFLPGAGELTEKALPLGEAMFSGAPKFFTRVFRGFDPGLRDSLSATLKARLPSVPDDFDEVLSDAFNEASAPLVAAGFKDLPIREAIDFVHTYLHLTVKACKFQFGVPDCGGLIEVAFISNDRRFRWVCHKGFDSAVREEEGRPWMTRPSS